MLFYSKNFIPYNKGFVRKLKLYFFWKVWIKLSVFYSLASVLIGGAAYNVIEILWRGYTHPTMALVGGLCFFVMLQIEKRLNASLFTKALLCALAITAIEFLSGCIINLFFHLNVWDYSYMKFNLLGQICLEYSVLWLFLSIPSLLLIKKVRQILF